MRAKPRHQEASSQNEFSSFHHVILSLSIVFEISIKSGAKIRIYTHFAKKYAYFSHFSLLFVTFTAKKQSI
jgi:hypothetical protein